MLHPYYLSPSFPLLNFPRLPLTPRSTPPFPFKREKATKRQKLNRTKQFTTRQDKNPHIKVEQDNPIGVEESQEQARVRILLGFPQKH